MGIKAEWMQSPLWMKDYHILLNALQSLQNDNNMLRRNLLNQGEIAMDAFFKPRRLRGGEGVSYPRSLYPRTERKSLSDLADEKIVQMIDDCTKIQTEWAERK